MHKAAVFFKTNSTELSELATATLVEFLSKIGDSETYNIEISGYADRTGNPEYNLLLSKQRAFQVRNFLVNQGLEEEYITNQYNGADLNLKLHEQAYGRRVEILLTK